MDSFEATKVVHSRILEFEPEYVTKKIIGYIYLQDHADREMIRLAFGPDNLIHNLIQKAKIELGLLASKPTVSLPIISSSVNMVPVSDLPLQFIPFSPAATARFQVPTPFWNPHFAIKQQPMHNMDCIPEFPVKACHYFNKGFCKHGSNCRYFHGESFPESYPFMFGPNSNEVANEDQLLSPGSLEKLEMEITEILKSRRGSPISIASLPMIYYEKYGRTLQAEGYLTESQRHGKAGYSLTKLLARLKNSIRMIDRPHGQHSVVLAEDAPKYMENPFERNEPGPIVSGSRQIYLTFPAESTFTEEDVSNYFNTFGPVQDVRIPCQQKRMFGFVTFFSAETVKMILAKGNPHYVCGARVLVKPYRDKPKLVDRKYPENIEPSVYYHSHHVDIDSELQAIPTGWESSRLLRKQLLEEHEQVLELESRLSELQLARKSPSNQSYFGYSVDGLNVSGDHSKFPSAERFNYLLDVLNVGSTSYGNPNHMGTNYTNQEKYERISASSQGLDLPDSPFASPLASGISMVT